MVALSRQTMGHDYVLANEDTSTGKEHPLCVLSRGRLIQAVTTTGDVALRLGRHDCHLGQEVCVRSLQLWYVFLYGAKCKTTVWTGWLPDEHAEKYEEEEKRFGGAGGILYVVIPSHLSSAKTLRVKETMAVLRANGRLWLY